MPDFAIIALALNVFTFAGAVAVADRRFVAPERRNRRVAAQREAARAREAAAAEARRAEFTAIVAEIEAAVGAVRA